MKGFHHFSHKLVKHLTEKASLLHSGILSIYIAALKVSSFFFFLLHLIKYFKEHMPSVLCMWNSHSYRILIILAIKISNDLSLSCCQDQKASGHLIKYMQIEEEKGKSKSTLRYAGFKKTYRQPK